MAPMRWVSPSLKKGTYRKFIVPQVTFFPAPRTSDQVKLETLQKISDYLTEQARKELSENFEITDVAGPDTLNFQVVITGVSTPLEGLKAYEVTPISLVFAGSSAALGYRDHVAVVYVEGLVTDSVTGAEVAKAVRQGVGKNLQDEKQQLDVENVKKLLNSWAAGVARLANELL